MYAIPLNRFVLLHVISRTSRTFPTLEKNSSKSLARIRCDNCMQNTVRASRSSGSRSAGGERFPKLFGGVRPRRNGRGGDGDRRRTLDNYKIYINNAAVCFPSYHFSVFCG